MWFQKIISMAPQKRGFHLITNEITKQIPEISKFRVGIAHLLLQHTSASLTLNENADPDVRRDLESFINKIVPEGEALYKHTLEGSDDLPAHLKSSIFGVILQLPITDGGFNLGTWQGVYLNEHRNYGGSRKIIITLFGE